MGENDEYTVKLFCFRFFTNLNSRNLESDMFDVSHNVRSEIVYKCGTEIFETSVPVNFSTKNSDNKEFTKDILKNLSSKFKLISNESLLKYYKTDDGLFIVSVNGRAFTRDGNQFGIFRNMIQFTVDQNKNFVVKNLISKVVCSHEIIQSGNIEETYFEVIELN